MEKEVNRNYIYKGRLLNLREDRVLLPTGKESAREIVEHPGAVAVVAITTENEIVLVRQYRKAVGESLLEIPAGVPNPGETGDDCARRELEEETGFHAKKIRKLGEGFASPGYSNELIQYYLAEQMTRMMQKTDEDEFIEVDLVDMELAYDMAKRGKIKDNKTMIGIFLADLILKGEI